jgi:hypothetical protein
VTTDARISTTLPDHPKTKKLIRRTGDAGAWYLVRLFLWVAANRSDGSLTGMSDEDIEIAVDWPGEPGAFVRTLVEVRFLDGESGDHQVHDWAEHNPWAASSRDRSEAASWAALCKQYGHKGAAERMPEYAARKLTAAAGGTSAPAPQESAVPNCATGTAGRSDPQCDPQESAVRVAENSSAPSPSPSPYPYPSENTPHKPPRGQTPLVTLRVWLDAVKAAGDKAIPKGDPVFAYADGIALPREFLDLAWIEFRSRYTADTQDGRKRYRDWREVFRKAVRGNWLNLWRVNEGQYALTTAGEQARRAAQERPVLHDRQPTREAA